MLKEKYENEKETIITRNFSSSGMFEHILGTGVFTASAAEIISTEN
ncbi:MAG: hypothetical protein WC292_03850 [Clostridia bacterium]